MLVALVLAAAAVLLYLAWRANELFCISVRDGKVLVVRGRIPQGLLSGFAEAVARPPLRRATIRAQRGPNGARLTVSGIDEFLEQRLRNIFHLYPPANLTAAPLLQRRNVGQFLGVVWLAWLLDRSR